jgi:hypothetical protein
MEANDLIWYKEWAIAHNCRGSWIGNAKTIHLNVLLLLQNYNWWSIHSLIKIVWSSLYYCTGFSTIHSALLWISAWRCTIFIVSTCKAIGNVLAIDVESLSTCICCHVTGFSENGCSTMPPDAPHSEAAKHHKRRMPLYQVQVCVWDMTITSTSRWPVGAALTMCVVQYVYTWSRWWSVDIGRWKSTIFHYED